MMCIMFQDAALSCMIFHDVHNVRDCIWDAYVFVMCDVYVMGCVCL